MSTTSVFLKVEINTLLFFSTHLCKYIFIKIKRNAIEKFDGCLPLKSYFVVGLEKDLETFKYKLCSMQEMDS